MSAVEKLLDELMLRYGADMIGLNGRDYEVGYRVYRQLRQAVEADRQGPEAGSVKVEMYPGPGDAEITICVERHDDFLTIVDDGHGLSIDGPMVGYLRRIPDSTEQDDGQ